jgi:ribosomal protein S14
MLFLKYKDIKNRQEYYKREINKNAIKFFIINSLNKKNLDKKLQKKLLYYCTSKLDKKYSKTKLQRRCLLTNRSKVSHRVFGISRIKLREMLKFNIIPGYKKAVW